MGRRDPATTFCFGRNGGPTVTGCTQARWQSRSQGRLVSCGLYDTKHSQLVFHGTLLQAPRKTSSGNGLWEAALEAPPRCFVHYLSLEFQGTFYPRQSTILIGVRTCTMKDFHERSAKVHLQLRRDFQRKNEVRTPGTGLQPTLMPKPSQRHYTGVRRREPKPLKCRLTRDSGSGPSSA